MWYQIIEILVTYFECFICILCANDILCKKTADKRTVVKFFVLPVIYTIIISLCNQIAVVSQFNLIISMAVLTILVLLLSYSKLIYCAMTGISYMVFILILDMFSICFISVITGDADYINKILTNSNITRITYIILMKIILGVLYLILRKRLRKFDYKIMSKPAFICSILVGLVMVMTMMEAINNNDNNALKIGIAIMFIAFIIIIIFVMYLSELLIKNQAKIDEQQYINMKNKILEENFIKINNLYEENSKSFHEFKHHIEILNVMLENAQYDKMKKYLSGINMVNKYNSEFMTGNEMVDMVLNVKYAYMKEKGINFNADINISKTININDTDICSLLSNLLDNAIEACENVVDKNINLLIKTHGNMIIFTVINPCENQIDTNNINSSKNGNHGWGLKIIKDVVNKYDGELSLEAENGIFTARAMILQEVSDSI